MIRSDKGLVELHGSKALLMVELITTMRVFHNKLNVTEDELKIAVEQACMSSEEVEKSANEFIDVISKLLAERFTKDLFGDDAEYEDDEEDDDDEYNL